MLQCFPRLYIPQLHEKRIFSVCSTLYCAMCQCKSTRVDVERLMIQYRLAICMYVQIMPYNNYVKPLSAADIIHCTEWYSDQTVSATHTKHFIIQTRKCGIDDSESAILCIVRRPIPPKIERLDSFFLVITAPTGSDLAHKCSLVSSPIATYWS